MQWTYENVALHPCEGSGSNSFIGLQLNFPYQFSGCKSDQVVHIFCLAVFGRVTHTWVWNNDVSELVGWIEIGIWVWVDHLKVGKVCIPACCSVCLSTSCLFYTHSTAVSRHTQGDVPRHVDNPWYHGNISSWEAEKRLKAENSDCFLVRKSQSKPGNYTLSVRYKGVVKDFLVHNKRGYYEVDGTETKLGRACWLLQVSLPLS